MSLQYVHDLYYRIIKLLPLRQDMDNGSENFFLTYLDSLNVEVIGVIRVVEVINEYHKYDKFLSDLISTAAILQYLADKPDEKFPVFRREVLKAANIIKKYKEAGDFQC